MPPYGTERIGHVWLHSLGAVSDRGPFRPFVAPPVGSELVMGTADANDAALGIRRVGRTALYWVHTPMNRSHVIDPATKSRGPIPPQCDGAGHACRGAGRMARLYRLALNGRIRSDEMTRFIYALKEIRACLEAELLTDVQQRLVLLSRDMDNHNGQRIPHQPAFTGR